MATTLTNITLRTLSNGARLATYFVNGQKAATFVPREVFDKCEATGDDFWFRLWIIPDLVAAEERAVKAEATQKVQAVQNGAEEVQAELDAMLQDVAAEAECFDGDGMWAVPAELPILRALEGSGMVNVGQREKANGSYFYWVTITEQGRAHLATL